MRKFELFYKEHIIGKIEIDNDNFLYMPNNEKIKEIEDDSIIFNFLKEKLNVPHPFITSRINNMDKFNMKSVKYENSNYELKEII